MTPDGDKPSIILASASPRRRDLLTQVGLTFSVQPSTIAEDSVPVARPGPEALVEAVALAKALDVAPAASSGLGPLVIGADTVVVLDGRVLGKPAHEQEAEEMLAALAGRRHHVYTGLALVDAGTGRRAVAHEKTGVTLRPLDSNWIRAYTATGEPMDKAGAYAVQGLGSVLVERIEGCYFNVVGLPLARLARMLEDWGFSLPQCW